jgi:cyclopropane fatty-acyl-phospholipid synthase-like methyltransferase
MATADRYLNYSAHYARTGRHEPDWQAAGENALPAGRRPEWLPLDKNARILDVGCGWGSLLLSLWRAGYRRLEGVDASPEQAAAGKRLVKGRVQLHCRDGREFLSEHRSEFDLIILFSVIEHIPADEVVGFLNEARQALVPGGRLVLFAPNMANLTSMWIQFSDITHTTGFTEFSVQQVLDQAGFENHQLVRQNARDLSQWSILRPWRGLGLGQLANDVLHRVVYRITGQFPQPSCFAANLEIYSHRPDPGLPRSLRQ